MNVCLGGTDIISCFAGQNPMLPVYQGEIQARNLGMAVECWNYDGEQCYDIVLCHCFYKLCIYTGEEVFDESGELVCTRPFPSMPTHFWNDEDGIKYHKAYFAKFSGEHESQICDHLWHIALVLVVGVWAHGDFCSISSSTGGIFMLGRRLAAPVWDQLLLVFDAVYLCSDGTLNPSGVRFGSAEIYNIGKKIAMSYTASKLYENIATIFSQTSFDVNF